ncbi:McrB family protein [Achromobacter dolens]|uniref:McrB family protein n=1 Tax=Achromobacter dolens TaxID=1287738 RepID=UPI0006BFD406|nr:AAA family ATPase [Achromobacter dolens]CUI86907.1 5-methylcytosine-specific restriction enzyme B [Achromobacter dolens]
MNEQEIAHVVAKAAGVEEVLPKIRPGNQIKANALWEGSCSPTHPRKTVGLFLARDGATALAIEGAQRRLTLTLPFPEAAVVISRPTTNQRQAMVVGYADSKRLRRLSEALGVAPILVERPSFAQPPEKTSEPRQYLTHSEDDLGRLVSSLRETPNVVLQGPPGTGKSSVALALTHSLAAINNIGAEDCRFGRLVAARGGDPHALQDDPEILGLPLVWEFVQLHPGYAYDDLVRRVVPATEAGGHLRLHVHDGLLPHLCRLAESRGPGKPVMLVLDEINRCNLASVLGEFLLGIDPGHRGVPVRLQVQSPGLESEIAVPHNLWIVGTMNTADRSIAMVDYAVRRRFRFLDVQATRDSVHSWYAPVSEWGEIAAALFDSCNAGLPPRLRIGPSLFLVMTEPMDNWPERLARRVAYEVLPLLCEYAKEGLRDRSPVVFGPAVLPIDEQKVAASRLAATLRDMLAVTQITGLTDHEAREA